MSDSESDDDDESHSSSASLSLSESSISSSSSSSSSATDSQPSASVATNRSTRANRGRTDTPSVSSNLTSTQNVYHGFTRKPSTESHASIGRKRQERSYSDSENSYENDIPGRGNREGRGFYPLHGNEDFHWGRQPLWQGLAIEKIENLVAWAHYGADWEPKNSSLFIEPTMMPTEIPLLHQEFADQHPYDETRTRNPLMNYVNTPLPLSFLNYFMLRSIHVPEFSDGLWESFDDSALVAIGMIVEEILTASLLPLAGLHALRCKQLEARPTKDEALLAPVTQVSLTHPIITNQEIQFDTRNLPDDESAFTAWTLPPEEAICKLAAQGMIPDTGTPLVHDPIRSSSRNKAFHRSTNKEIVGRIFQQLGIDPKPNQEYCNLFLSSETKRKPPPPVEDDDNTNINHSQTPNKRIRITEV